MFQVGPQERAEVEAFLARDPIGNLPFLTALENASPHVYAVRNPAGELDGVALHKASAGLVHLATIGEEAAVRLGEGLRGLTSAVLGDRWMGEAFWRAATDGAPFVVSPRWLCCMTANEMGPFTCPQLRPARPADLPLLAEGLQRAAREDGAAVIALGVPVSWSEAELEEAVGSERAWLLEEGGELALVVLLEGLSRHGALIASVLTLPPARGKGLATLAAGQICRTLLASMPMVVAHVDGSNRAAMGLTRKLGFVLRRRLELLTGVGAPAASIG